MFLTLDNEWRMENASAYALPDDIMKSKSVRRRIRGVKVSLRAAKPR